MKFAIKEVAIIDSYNAGPNIPSIVQCHVGIGVYGSPGSDIFVADICNEAWANAQMKIDGKLLDFIIVVDQICEESIAAKIRSMLLLDNYSLFEDLVKGVHPLLRWEFA